MRVSSRLSGLVGRAPAPDGPPELTAPELRTRLRRARARARRLQAELTDLRARYDGPSHQAQLTAAWREWRHVRTAGGVEEGRQFDNKLVSYAFAQSHGVAFPTLHGRWESLDDIDPVALAAAPESSFLKAAHGAAALGVVATDDAAEIASALSRWRTLARPTELRLDPPVIAPPYFTEERLRPEGELLLDIKVFAFYGEVAQVLLLAVPDYRDRSANRMRVLGPDGADLGPVVTTAPIDPDLPVPGHLAEIVDVARRLSLALRRPFVRLDFYDTGDRALLGEITPMPGNVNRYVRAHDAFLGEHWERARGRMRADVAAGLDPRVVWGPGPRELVFRDASPWRPGELAHR
ncbi:ATP-grasp fold amidoligase family protein [Pimelobacter simplex]|uniref:ATP-grasp fold amidoligase family protein n=1 Tax=Nocardioides simplex TaxID=2045 RepID=UPI0038173D21